MSLPIDLISADGASAYIGAGMFFALCRNIRQAANPGRIIYDCGDRRGDLIAGLRAGTTDLCLDADAFTPSLLQLAERYDALLQTRPLHCLEWDGKEIAALATHLSHS